MSTILKCKLQAKSRVPEMETINKRVRRLTDELDSEIEDLKLIEGEANLKKLTRSHIFEQQLL